MSAMKALALLMAVLAINASVASATITSVKIGGLFPMVRRDGSLDGSGSERMQAFRLAMNEINASPFILPNVSLDWAIADSQRDAGSAFFAANYLGEWGARAVVGAASSGPTGNAQLVLREYQVPQISYSATSGSLSDKIQYPYFMRTPPSDAFQAAGMVELIKEFGWTRVATMSGLDSYSVYGIEEFNKYATIAGLTVLASQSFNKDQVDFSSEIAALEASQARIVIIFSTAKDAGNLLSQMHTAEVGGPDFVLIGSDAVSKADTTTQMTANGLTNAEVDYMMKGYLGFIPGAVDATWAPKSAFETAWTSQASTRTGATCSTETDANGKVVFDRQSDTLAVGVNTTLAALDPDFYCIGFDPYVQPINSYAYYAYDAAYTIAYALHDMIEINGWTSFTGLELLDYMKGMEFNGATGRVGYDAVTGDRNLGVFYNILNYQSTALGFVDVASWTPGQNVTWTGYNSIVWSTGEIGGANAPADQVPATAYIKVGALFPTIKTDRASYARDGSGIERLHAFIIALNEVNDSTTLLPNSKLVWAFEDSQRDEGSAFFGASQLGQWGAKAVVGAASSGPTGNAALVFKQYSVPQISYSATSPSLSDFVTYPYFFRTVASDALQALAMVDFIQEYNWTQVATLAGSDTYSEYGINKFLEIAALSGVSVTRSLRFNTQTTVNFDAEIASLKDVKARVIVLFCQGFDAGRIMDQAYSKSVGGEGFVFIGADAVAKPDAVAETVINDADLVWKGFVGFLPGGGGGASYNNFVTAWQNFTPTMSVDGAGVVTCSSLTDDRGTPVFDRTAYDPDPDPLKNHCTGIEAMPTTPNSYAPFAYDAVYTIANALHDLVEVQGKTSIVGAELKEAILATNFQGITGQVTFDAVGDRLSGIQYDIVNYQLVEGSASVFATVGNWRAESGTTVSADIVWSNGLTVAPTDTVPETAYVTIGALFPMFKTANNGYSRDGGGIQRLHAFLMALEEINTHTAGSLAAMNNLLPNTNLGFIVGDSKRDEGVAFFEAQTLANAGVKAVVGAASSGPTKNAHLVFKQSSITQISYSATSPDLSDITAYPYFFRTPPSDAYQAVAMVAVVKYFGWSEVATIATNDAYGSAGISAFAIAALDAGLTTKGAVDLNTEAQAPFAEEAAVLKNGKAKIIVMFAQAAVSGRLLVYLRSNGIGGEGYVFIAADSVAKSDTWANMANPDEIMLGMIGVLPGGGDTSNTYYQNWLARWQAQTPTAVVDGNGDIVCSQRTDDVGNYVFNRTSNDLDPSPTKNKCAGLVDWNDSISNYAKYAYDAIYTVAFALHDLIEVQGKTQIVGAELKEAMVRVSFTGLTGQIGFEAETQDRNQGIVYEIVNYQTPTTGLFGRKRNLQQGFTGSMVQIGTFVAGTGPGTGLDFGCAALGTCQRIMWSDGTQGEENKPVDVKQKVTVYKVKATEDGIRYGFAGLNCLGLLACVVVALILFIKKDTKLIRAASIKFCLLSLFGAALMFAEALTVVDYPREEIHCSLQVWTYNIGFAILFGALFAKEWRISKIFNNVQLTRVAISDKDLFAYTGGIVGAMATIMIVWQVVNPVPVKEEMESVVTETKYQEITTTTVSSYCGFTEEESKYFYYVAMFFKALLLAWGVMLCVQTRSVTDIFNESKQIALAVYLTALLVIMRFVIDMANISADEPDIEYIINSILTVFIVSATVGVLYAAKIAKLLTDGDVDQWKTSSVHTFGTQGATTSS